MGTKLKLNQRRFLSMYNSLSDKLFLENNIRVYSDEELPIFFAQTHYDKNLYANEVHIGLKEITNYVSQKSFLRRDYIPDNYAILVFINQHHEYMHCFQNNVLFRKKQLSNDERKQLLQDVACINNDDFYFNNYPITASEVQAEQYGILQTYEYIKEQFPILSKNQCEKLVLDVVNEKMMSPHTGYFVKRSRPFTSLSEVNRAFDDAYQHALHTKRYYDVRDIDINHLDEADYAKQYLCSHPEVEYRYDFNALEQIQFIAAINIQRQPAHLDWYPALRTMDLPDVRGKPKDMDWRNREAELLVSNIEDNTDDHERNVPL